MCCARRDLSCEGCSVPALGRLVPELAQLEYLQQLDLSANQFFGMLPPAWGYNESFPQLLLL